MGKITQTLLALSGVASLASSAMATKPVQLQTRIFGGKTVHFVRVSLDSDNVLVQPMLARGGVGSSETLASMATRGAKVVLTGAFFDTRSLTPMGDIVIGKRLLHFGGRGAALCLRRVKGGEGESVS